MTNIKDLNSFKMDKNLGKVVDTLANDPFGLSAAQIANNSKMSLKTVKNCLAVLLQDEKIYLDDLGVYHTTQQASEVHAPPTQKETQLVVSAMTGAVKEVVKDQAKADVPTLPKAQVVGVEGFDAKITPTNLLDIIPGTPFKIEQPLPETPQDESKPIRARIIECIKSESHGAKPATVATALGLTVRQVRNSCYSLENLGCLRSENSGDERTFFYLKDIPRVRAEPRMTKPSTNKKAKEAIKSPFGKWIERRVVETETVKLTEEQLEEVLKHVFNMDQVTFLTPLPAPYVVELKSEVIR
jgi:hypothetical protein